MSMFKTLIEKLRSRKINLRLDCDYYKKQLSVLKVKNQILEKSISDFITNWPIFQEPFNVLMFSLIGKRPFYDSTWRILYQQDGVVKKIKIVREDTQSYEDLKQCLDRYTCLTDIMKLDMRMKIYYD